MIGLIRSIFGIARPKRSESEEATSKGKVFQDPHPRRTNSRDSKLRLETARKESRPESLFDSDEVYTIKKNRPASIRRPVRESLNLDLISDLGDGSSSRECELLSEVFENHSDKEFGSRVFPQTECSFR